MKRIIFILTVLALAAATRADTITMRASVRLDGDAAQVRLSDVAELVGAEAKKHADAIVAELVAGADTIELSVDDVRASLDAAGVHWGKVNLNGRAVVIRLRQNHAIETPLLAMQSVSILDENAALQDAKPSAVVARDIASESTARGMVARLLLRGLQRDPADVRFTFEKNDESVLSTTTNRYRVELEPLSALDSDRVSIRMRFWNGATVDSQHTVTVRPEVRTRSVVLLRDIEHDEKIAAADCAEVEFWRTPTQAARFAAMSDVVGRVASRSLRAEEPVERKHIARETIVERGDVVTVRCLVGGVAIAMQAEAREDGGRDQMIVFRKLGERDEFVARVVSRNEAVVDTSR